MFTTKYRRLAKTSATALAIALTWAAQVSAETAVVSDDFEGAAQDWKFRVFFYSDTGCATVSSGYPMYPPATDGAADARVAPADGWYNTSWTETGNDNAINGTSLVVADTDETVDTAGGTQNLCHNVSVFREIASSDSNDLGEGKFATYTVTAKAKANRYGANDDTAEVGVYFQVLENGTFSTIVNERRPVSPDADVSQDFQVDLSSKSDVIVLAGFYAQHDTGAGNVQASWDDFSVTWVPDSSAATAAENAACADTSTLRFEDPFGGAKVTCLTDTYTVPSDAESFAGFGDTKRNVDIYPFYKPESITFDCSTASGTADVSFQFENAPYPANTSVYRTNSVTCNSGTASVSASIGRQRSLEGEDDRSYSSAGASKTIAIPAGDTTLWGNLLLYVNVGGAPVTITNIQVNGGFSGAAATAASAADAEAARRALPVPTMPIWGLFGLTGLIGFMGLRRRRK